MITTIIEAEVFCPYCGSQHVDGKEPNGTDWASTAHRIHYCDACSRTFAVTVIGVRAATVAPKPAREFALGKCNEPGCEQRATVVGPNGGLCTVHWGKNHGR